MTDEEKKVYNDIRLKKKEEYAQFWIDHPDLIGYKKVTVYNCLFNNYV